MVVVGDAVDDHSDGWLWLVGWLVVAVVGQHVHVHGGGGGGGHGGHSGSGGHGIR